jgi:hypothetical protein
LECVAAVLRTQKNSKPLTTEVARSASDVVALVIGVAIYVTLKK